MSKRVRIFDKGDRIRGSGKEPNGEDGFSPTPAVHCSIPNEDSIPFVTKKSQPGADTANASQLCLCSDFWI